jgi:hypothetical protein
LEVKSVTKPNISTISTTIERLIKEEIEIPIKTIITPIEEPIYIAPVVEEQIVYSTPTGGGGGGGGFVENDFGTGFGRERVVDRNLVDRQNIQ